MPCPPPGDLPDPGIKLGSFIYPALLTNGLFTTRDTDYEAPQDHIIRQYEFESIYKVMMQRRQWHPTPVLLPGKSHGQRSLVGCIPWGSQESDTTEQIHFHFSISCIGEGNGNLLQCSCLENPRDGGAWWAAIYGISQSRT